MLLIGGSLGSGVRQVKDLEEELESTKVRSKEKLYQAILMERERVTEMQWDMEELRRKSLEMEFKLTSQSQQVFLFQKTVLYKCNMVYEDDKVVAFRDIAPQAPIHILLIPKNRDGLTGLNKAEERHIGIIGHLLYIAKVVAKQEGLEEGFGIVINVDQVDVVDGN